MDKLKKKFATYRSKYWGPFSSGNDYFIGLDLLLVLAGVKFETSNERHRRWWSYYRRLIITVIILMNWKFVQNLIRWENVGVVLNCVQIEFGAMTVLLRAAVIGWHYEDLMTVREFINRRQYGHDTSQSLEFRSSAYYKMRRNVTFFMVSQVSCVIPLLLLDLGKIDSLGLAFDFTPISPWLQIVCSKLYSISLLVWPWIQGMDVLVLLMILTGFITELQVVLESFKNLETQVDELVQAEAEPMPENSQRRQDLQPLFWKHFISELKSCIQQHQELLANLDTANPLLNKSFLLIYYSNVMAIACGVVFLLLPVKNFIFLIQIVYLTTLMLVECLIFTSLVTRLTELNESIGWQLYNLDWPERLQYHQDFNGEYRSARCALLTMMAQSQQPLGLNCCGFFEFTQEKIADLVDMAYSLMSFFWNFV